MHQDIGGWWQHRQTAKIQADNSHRGVRFFIKAHVSVSANEGASLLLLWELLARLSTRLLTGCMRVYEKAEQKEKIASMMHLSGSVKIDMENPRAPYRMKPPSGAVNQLHTFTQFILVGD